MRALSIGPRLFRHAVILPLASLAALWAWSLSLDAGESVVVEMGPGARDYVQGASQSFVFDGENSWRRLETRARVFLPLNVEGPGTLTLTVRARGPSPADVRAELDDLSLGTLPLTPDSAPSELRFQIPDGRRRAVVRLRTGAGPGSVVEMAGLGFQVAEATPSRNAARAFLSLVALTYLALAISGLRPGAALAGTLGVLLPMTALALADGFAALHLASRLAPVALIGAVAMPLIRLVAPGSSAPLRGLFLAALFFKSALLFHPRFYFVDLPIHETILELVYHRGALDFWERLPEYQEIHNLGVAPVGGESRALPYPVAFYFLAGAGNRLHHAPELWLKLTAALLAALALFPLGALAKKLSGKPQAEVFAALAYLLAPSMTRSLLLLELSAIAGCFFDLLALAVLAHLSLRLSGIPRFALATGVMTVALAVYTAAFIHLGLFVLSALVLGAFGRGLVRRELALFAAAGLLSSLLALFAYHPDTVRVLPDVVMRGADELAARSDGFPGRIDSTVSRVLGFVGIPLLGLGAFGVGAALAKLDAKPLKLLFESWVLSALAALGLRFLFPRVFLYAKELYWGGGLLALGAGSLLAGQWSGSRYRRLFAAFALAALFLVYAVSLRGMVRQFYSTYLFL